MIFGYGEGIRKGTFESDGEINLLLHDYLPNYPIQVFAAEDDAKVNGMNLRKGETIEFYPDKTWKIWSNDEIKINNK